MLSANINLARLWLHCSVQALAESGCNCHYPKRHCLTLAMQIFSSNSATYLHQQVCFCSGRTFIKPLSVQSYPTAELILQQPVLEGTVPSSLIPLSPVMPPTISLTPDSPGMAIARPEGQTSRKPSSTFYFRLFSVCQPGENRRKPKFRKKTWTIPFPWQLDQASCTSKAQSDPSKSFRGRETKQEHYLICLDTLTSPTPKCHPCSSLLSHSRVSGGPLLFCQ